MRLKEFDLDAPSAGREARHDFRLRTRCMTALYERSFPGLVVDGGWKVLVECVDQVVREEIRNLLGVFVVQVAFAHQEFSGAGIQQQKAMALDAIHAGAIRIAMEKGWSPEPFELARASVIRASWVNAWGWPGARWNRARSRSATLSCLHDVDRFRAWLVVCTRSGAEIGRDLVIDTPPDEFLFAPLMGKLLWTSNERVVLLARSGEEVASIQVE